MMWLYSFLFAVCLVVFSPFYLYRLVKRGNFKEGFFQRFGFFSEEIRRPFREHGGIWIRAVSVGEVAEALVIIEQLRQRAAHLTLALSVTTTTGYQVAKRRAPQGVVVTYYPLDFAWCVKRALRCFQPRLIVLVESDIWPNLMCLAVKRGIPVALINARISEKSLRGYQRAGFLFRKAFNSLALACAPDETAARRLADVGVPNDRVHIVGSLKYEVAAMPDGKTTVAPNVLLRNAGASENAVIFVAGSTHPGEEEILLEMLPRLRSEIPGLFMVLAPRHAERGLEVAQLAAQKGVTCVRRSVLSVQPSEANLSPSQCLLLDTTGELKAFYRMASVIFVGKSLVGRGGQNILEAVFTGNPVIFGPHMENFEAIARELVEAGAAVQVANATDLEKAFRELAQNPEQRRALTDAAQKVFQRNLGAAARTTELLIKLLHQTENRFP